jgi:hypothetical protein
MMSISISGGKQKTSSGNLKFVTSFAQVILVQTILAQLLAQVFLRAQGKTTPWRA